MSKLLQVDDLQTSFFTKFGEVKAVNHVSFDLDEGEIIAIVGESGSGKSVTSLSIMQLLSHPGKTIGGSIKFNDVDLLKLKPNEMDQIRGKEIGMIFQDPMTSLNPVLTIGYQMEEVLKRHRHDLSKSDREKHCLEMLDMVGISDPKKRMSQYAHELSGGMRQRIMIAMSLLCNPKLLIADEPTTALDVTIQAQIMDLMQDLRAKFNTAIILITHDLGVVASMAQKVIVMYAGEIIEYADIRDLYYNPQHPYTWGLLKALPRLDMEKSSLHPIPGQTPDLLLEQKGCMFYDRCEYAMECCRDHKPPYFQVGENHISKCFRLHPDFKENVKENDNDKSR